MEGVRHDRFHGRHPSGNRQCDWQGCDAAGEFRAPGSRGSGFDGPGEYRWFCLEHVRAFNSGYDYFAGMSQDEIFAAQSPIAGWERETRAFVSNAGIDSAPRWADYADPLEAISARSRDRKQAAGMRLTADERRALDVLALPSNADRKALRQRYSELVRKYHPDRNGGDRNFEARLQQVVEAYQTLRKSEHFSGR